MLTEALIKNIVYINCFVSYFVIPLRFFEKYNVSKEHHLLIFLKIVNVFPVIFFGHIDLMNPSLLNKSQFI